MPAHAANTETIASCILADGHLPPMRRLAFIILSRRSACWLRALVWLPSYRAIRDRPATQ
jgi:hypothetical protein